VETVYETRCTIYGNLLESNDGGLTVRTVFYFKIVLSGPIVVSQHEQFEL
jgi:hypothetical protein